MNETVIDGLQITWTPGVYPPASDTELLLEWIRQNPPAGDVLELCTGTGTLALAAARTARSVTAVDRCPHAVATVDRNAARNHAAVAVHLGDLFGPVVDRQFDLILANPPYMPTPQTGGGIRSDTWDAGWAGRAVLDRIAGQAAGHLRPSGRILVVQSAFADDARTATLLAAAGLAVRTVERRVQSLGPVSRARTDHLEALGVLDPAAPADELVLLEGRRP